MTELEKMQQEAVSSAKAMYKRRSPVRTVSLPPNPQPPNEPPAEENPPPQAQPSRRNDLINSIFEDKEKALIILLIILLSEDGADSGVILALLYCII